MGSGMEYMDQSQEGILPRAILHIFKKCDNHERDAEANGFTIPKCVVSCQFIEVNIFMYKT